MTISKTPEKILFMFDMLAKRYDLMNDLISFGLHRVVKQKAIDLLDIKPHSRILDACCGTGDLIFYIKQRENFADVVGVDFSSNMVDIAKRRFENIDVRQGDVTNLEFDDNSFDFVTMSFGLRNIANPEKALKEVYRVLKPGGIFLHLDFGSKNLPSFVFDLLVSICSSVMGENRASYKYLIESKKVFPNPKELIEDFKKCGFRYEQRKDFLFGVISAQIMKK